MLIPPKMIDSFAQYDTKNVMLGKWTKIPNNYIGTIITSVIKSYTISNIKNNIDDNEWSVYFDEFYEKNPEYSYDDLAQSLAQSMITENENSEKYPTFEYVISGAMYAYKSQDAELITRMHNTFGRTVKLPNKSAWLDNWSLNGPGNTLNFIFWKNYDSPDIITYDEYNNEISKDLQNSTQNVTINAKSIVTIDEIKNKYYNSDVSTLVGPFRAFLIVNHLLPKADYKIESAKDVIEVCTKYFPIYYIGAIACNWFDDTRAPSIEHIKSFIERHPGIYVVSIVNTVSSEDSSGAHWMGLAFINKNDANRSILMCSQGSSWDAFRDGGKLLKTLENNGFVLSNNSICCQYDRCNCGIYSFLFIFEFILKKGSLEEAIKEVGANAESMRSDKTKPNINDKMIFIIKNSIFGYNT